MKKLYSVFCGGSEVNNYYLSLEEAENLKIEYENNNYDDVSIQEYHQMTRDIAIEKLAECHYECLDLSDLESLFHDIHVNGASFRGYIDYSDEELKEAYYDYFESNLIIEVDKVFNCILVEKIVYKTVEVIAKNKDEAQQIFEDLDSETFIIDNVLNSDLEIKEKIT